MVVDVPLTFVICFNSCVASLVRGNSIVESSPSSPSRNDSGFTCVNCNPSQDSSSVPESVSHPEFDSESYFDALQQLEDYEPVDLSSESEVSICL